MLRLLLASAGVHGPYVRLPCFCSSVFGAVGRGGSLIETRVANQSDLPERDVLQVEQLVNGQKWTLIVGLVALVRGHFLKHVRELGGKYGHGRIESVVLVDHLGHILGEILLDVGLIAYVHKLVLDALVVLHPLHRESRLSWSESCSVTVNIGTTHGLRSPHRAGSSATML